jgi:type-F conjugative transfer system secretin TraK
MKSLKTSLGCCLLGLSLVAGAETLSFDDNQTLSVRMSQENINKLFVANDPIVDLHVPEGYVISSDDDEGAIYLQLAMTSPFTIYVNTEQGHHVGLTITPVRSMGNTIQLVPKTATPMARDWEEKKGYEATLIALMRAMLEQKDIKGYGKGAPEGSILSLDEIGKLTPKMRYQGVHFTGTIYTLCNDSHHDVILEEKDFYRDGVEAVTILSKRLVPSQSTTVFEITKKEVI